MTTLRPRPSSCPADSLSALELRPELGVDLHVAMVRCVRDGAMTEIARPDVTINRRDVQLDTWLVTGDGSILVLLSDPGRTTGFFCC